jgi:hypothetical protein
VGRKTTIAIGETTKVTKNAKKDFSYIFQILAHFACFVVGLDFPRAVAMLLRFQ